MKQTHKLSSPIAALTLFLFTVIPWDNLKSQVTNGVFDPSKAQNRSRADELKKMEISILSANEFNRTLGTPDHPGSVAAPAANTVVPPAPTPTYTVHQSEPPPKRIPRSVIEPDLAVPSFARPSSSNRGPLTLLARALSPGPHGDLAQRPSLFADNRPDVYLEDFDYTAPVLETTEIANSGSDALDQTLQNLDLPQFAPQTRSNNPFDLIARALAPGPSGPVDRNATNAIPAVNFILRALAPGPQRVGRQTNSDLPTEFDLPDRPTSNSVASRAIGNTEPQQPLRTADFGSNDPLDALIRALSSGSNDNNNIGNNSNAIRPFNFIMRALAPGPIDSPADEEYQVNFSAPVQISAEPVPIATPTDHSAAIAPEPRGSSNENKPFDFIMRALAPGPHGSVESGNSSAEPIPSVPNFTPATPVDLPQ